MEWSVADFMSAAAKVMPLYRSKHGWFHGWDDKSDTEVITHAWILYSRAYHNELGMLVLGDAKIRSGSLLANFGLASGNDIADLADSKQIKDIDALRKGLETPESGPAVATLGPGSILNDTNWTPLLNDAFILGGVHATQDFYWAEEGLNRFSEMGEAEFARNRAVFGGAVPQAEDKYRDRLRRYLLSGSNFWMDGNVRIFAREVLGLKKFGYSFVITGQAMRFTPTGGGQATFQTYLDALTEAHYFESAGGSSIKRALAELLFGDPSALESLDFTPKVQKKLTPVTKPPGWPS